MHRNVKQIAARILKGWEQRSHGIIDLASISSVKKIYECRKRSEKIKGTFVLRSLHLNEGYERQGVDHVAIMESLFDSLSPQARRRFLKHLISLIDDGLVSDATDLDEVVDLQFARFLVENLLVLEYKDKCLVANVVQLIDSVVRRAGVPLIHTFESGLQECPVKVLTQQCLVITLLLQLKKSLLQKYYGTGTSSSVRTKSTVNELISDWENLNFLELTHCEAYEQLHKVKSQMILLI